jgi:hypothetical protein
MQSVVSLACASLNSQSLNISTCCAPAMLIATNEHRTPVGSRDSGVHGPPRATTHWPWRAVHRLATKGSGLAAGGGSWMKNWRVHVRSIPNVQHALELLHCLHQCHSVKPALTAASGLWSSRRGAITPSGARLHLCLHPAHNHTFLPRCFQCCAQLLSACVSAWWRCVQGLACQ